MKVLSLASHFTQNKVSTRNPSHNLTKLQRFKTHSPEPEHIPGSYWHTIFPLRTRADPPLPSSFSLSTINGISGLHTTSSKSLKHYNN